MAKNMASRENVGSRKAAPETAISAEFVDDQAFKRKKNYKSAHSIGSRKATEKVITYNDTVALLTVPLPAMVQQPQPRLADTDIDKKRSPAKRKRADSSPDRDGDKKKAKKDLMNGDITPKKATQNGKTTPVKGSPAKSTGKTTPTKSPAKANSGKTTPVKAKTSPAKSAVKKVSSDTSPKSKKSPTKTTPTKDNKKETTDSKKKKEAVKCKKKETEKKKTQHDKKNNDSQDESEKTKKARKSEEKEIPSLSSFIKPRREASLNASAMVNIMFERLPPSPKKESKSPSTSPSKQSPKTLPKNASKKSCGPDKDSKAALKSQTEQKRAESQRKKSPKNSTKSTAKKKSAKDEKQKSKVVKRKTKTRMASLNARALIVAERESLQMALERAARTDRYCVSWKHESPPNKKPHLHHETARWVDGRGDTCCVDHLISSVCPPKKEVPSGTDGTSFLSEHTPDVVSTNVPSTDVKSPLTVHTGSLVPVDKEIVVSDDRPSSVVDVVGAHTPVKAPILGASSCSYGSFGGLYGHSTACISPCPGYSYSHTEGYITTSGYQSFTLSGMSTLAGMPVMTPAYRTSAFSVPYNPSPLPYSYYPGGYYPPAASTLLQQPIPQPACLLPHHVPVKVPHAQIKVLIHNPDTPQDLAAFSENRNTKKGVGSGIETTAGKNDSNNNNGSYRGNTVVKSSGNGNSKANGSVNSKASSASSKSNGSLNTKSNGNVGRPNSANGKKQTASDKSKSDSSKKKESHVVLKSKDAEKQAKRRYEKKTTTTKADKETGEVKKEVKEKKKDKALEHGWSWVGEGEVKKVASIHMEQPATERLCYRAIKHRDGDIVNVRDCVLLRSGPCKSDVPYVAKVGALWPHPETGEMMMSLLWFYQPEHTEAGRQPHDLDCEVFASRHRDENSVACIDDKCYVLTYDQFCRYRAEMRRIDDSALPRCRIVPDLIPTEPSKYPPRELPDQDVDPSNVFVCRKVYDFRQKRILKNPA